jgi:hypothetical protein
VSTTSTGASVEPGTYRITVSGRLGDGFADGFSDMTQTNHGSNTVLEGRYVDQSQLHGLLERLRGLGIEIISFDTSPKEAHR